MLHCNILKTSQTEKEGNAQLYSQTNVQLTIKLTVNTFNCKQNNTKTGLHAVLLGHSKKKQKKNRSCYLDLYICKISHKEMLITEQQLQMALQLTDNNIALL